MQAMEPFLASCRELESLHSDLHKVLTSVEAKRATETLTSTDDACKLMESNRIESNIV